MADKKRKKPVEIPSMDQVEHARKQLRYKNRYKRVLRSTVNVLIVVAAISVLVVTLIMPVLQIYGSSMSPTLEDGQIVLSVKTSNLKRGDLVSFYYGNKLLVKRCIAGPRDWVNIDEDGNIYINDELLDEPYLTEKAFGECDIELPCQVPDERWFLVGDNRVDSIDSRNTQVGFVANDQIVGKIVFRVWPLSEFGALGTKNGGNH